MVQQYVQQMALQYASNQSHSLESSYETAARLLFLTLNWVKSLPAFRSLPSSDQLILLEDHWSELFILNAAQFDLDFNPSLLSRANGQ